MLWFPKRGELFVSPRSYTVHKGGEGASNKPTRICNVKQWWICPHGASFAQLQVHIRSPFQVLMADCQRVPFENSLRRKLWEHAHGRNIFLTWLMLMGTSLQNAPLNLPAMLRCSKARRIRSKGKSSNSFHLSQPFAKCISSVPFILYLFFGKGWEKFQREFPLSRWWIHGTQPVLTLGTETLDFATYVGTASFKQIQIFLFHSSSASKQADSKVSPLILSEIPQIEALSQDSGHERIDQQRLKCKQRSTKTCESMTNRGKSDKVHSMAGPSGLYFSCGSQGYEILIRCTRNGWGVYIDAVHVQPVSTTIQQVGKTDGIHSIRPTIPSSLTDEAYTILMCLLDSQFLSTCQQTPRCEPDAIADRVPMLLWTNASCHTSGVSTMSRPSLLLTDWHVYWHVFRHTATYLAHSWPLLATNNAQEMLTLQAFFSQPWNGAWPWNPRAPKVSRERDTNGPICPSGAASASELGPNFGPTWL